MEASSAALNTLSALDDETLARRAATDFEAFAELYERYLCPVYRFLRSQTPDEATAEDLTANVFFKALSFAAGYRSEGTYKAWIFRIAQNTLSTWGAQRSRSAIAVEQVPDTIDPEPSPASLTIASEASGVVWQTVSELSPAQREVVQLRYLKDLTIEEIAGVTRRSSGAVRILLHRARAKLRSSLGGKDLG